MAEDKKDVYLKILQKSNFDNDYVHIATFTFRTTKKSAFEVEGKTGTVMEIVLPEFPLGFEWEKDVLKKNITTIKHETALEFKTFSIENHDNNCVRSLGGKKYRKEMYNYVENRGGYSFSPAKNDIKNLTGTAGIISENSILNISIHFEGKADFYCVPILFPEKPYEENIFDEVTLRFMAEIEFEGYCWKVDGPTLEFKAYEFINDGSSTAEQLKNALNVEYGNPAKTPPLHARDYVRYFDESTEISKDLVKNVKEVTNFLMAKIGTGGDYLVNGSEIGCTFLSEGAVTIVSSGINGGKKPVDLKFDGYNDLGIDTYVTAWKKNSGRVRVFTFSGLEAYITSNTNLSKGTNEKGQAIETFKELGFLNAVYAVGCLYADSKDQFAKDLKDEKVMGKWICKACDLPIHLQYFWTTLYYNTGKANGIKTLTENGLEYHDLIWKQEDDHAKYQGYEKYNANWRTATFRLVDANASL